MSTLSQTTSAFPADGRDERARLRQRPGDTLASSMESIGQTSADAEEVLVRDARAGLSPAQMVERKVLSLLNGRPLPANPVSWSCGRRPARSAEA